MRVVPGAFCLFVGVAAIGCSVLVDELAGDTATTTAQQPGEIATLDGPETHDVVACNSSNAEGLCGSPEMCVDGFCCDDPCLGACVSCSVGGMEGICVPVPAATDPDDDCAACYSCDGQGACALVSEGADHVNDCEERTGSDVCGATGLCDGAGRCALESDAIPCGAIECLDGPSSSAREEAFCDGAGGCTAQILPCGGYRCADDENCQIACQDSTDCAGSANCDGQICVDAKPEGASCLADFECASDTCINQICCEAGCGPGESYCDPHGGCRPKLPDGEPCTEDLTCHSGVCSDGVCCDRACASECESCTLATSPGTCIMLDDSDLLPANDGDCGLCFGCDGQSAQCVPIPAGADWKGECDNDQFCDGEESCNGGGNCSFGLPRCIGENMVCDESLDRCDIEFPKLP